MNDKLKKNTIWNTIGITFNSFNSLFFLIIINRINGVNTAGIYSFSYSIACLLYIVGIYSGRIYQVSDTKKELNAKEIYDMFKYENGKKYILNDLDNYDDISEDNQYYLNECHKIFKNIIDGLEIPEE